MDCGTAEPVATSKAARTVKTVEDLGRRGAAASALRAAMLPSNVPETDTKLGLLGFRWVTGGSGGSQHGTAARVLRKRFFRF